MLAKMAAHAGPWYVLEHVRPFPGVTLDRIIRQIRRGLITETSIVRGPSSDYQWRFAVETPGLCRYFSKCWHCQEAVSPSDTYCQHCLSNLSFEQGSPAESPAAPTGAPGQHQARPNDRRPLPAGRSGSASTEASRVNGGAPPQVAEPSSAPLTELSAALGQADLPHHEPIWDDPPRIGGLRATWVAAILVAIVIVVLLFITQSRSVNLAPPPIPGTILLEV